MIWLIVFLTGWFVTATALCRHDAWSGDERCHLNPYYEKRDCLRHSAHPTNCFRKPEMPDLPGQYLAFNMGVSLVWPLLLPAFLIYAIACHQPKALRVAKKIAALEQENEVGHGGQ